MVWEKSNSMRPLSEEEISILKDEEKELLKLEKLLKESLRKTPEGTIHAEMAKGRYPQYYLITKDGKKIVEKKYINKKENKLIYSLIKKEYEEKLQIKVKRRISGIEDFLEMYRATELHDVFERLPETKKCMLNSYTVSEEEFIEMWRESAGKEKNTFPILNGIITEQGEIVRSKSEKMIADKLFYSKIPYLYEAPLYLDTGKTIYPDFMLLNVRKRKTLFLEHFGMMDDPEYCKSAIEKLEKYAKNGLFPGTDLLFTMETSTKSLNMNYLDELIEAFLK